MYMTRDDHTGAILEVINDQLTAIQEGQAAMAKVPDDIREIKDRLTNVEADINVIKAAVTDQGHELKDHEVRITSLEQAA
jgi:archaellum component FlaC